MSAPATAALGDLILDAQSGFASGDDFVEGLFQVRMNNVTREGAWDLSKMRRVEPASRSDRYLLERGDVLVNTTNSPELVGKTALFEGIGEPASYSNHFTRLRVRRDVADPAYVTRWLQHAFQRGILRALAKQWVNQATINRDRLLAIRLPIPDLREQRRIADILDRADALRAQRRRTIALLNDLAASIFLDMFGDPVRNEQGWDRVALGELLDGIDSGTSPICLDRPAGDGEWGVLKLSAVTSCVFKPDENKALPPEVTPKPRDQVQPGDLLFTRKNTRALVGACALVDAPAPRLLLPDLVFRLKVTPDSGLLPTFLQRLLTVPAKRLQVQALAGGSAGSMPNISKARLSLLPVELPPLALQKEFQRRVNRIAAQRHQHDVQFAGLAGFHSALQHRAFRGKL